MIVRMSEASVRPGREEEFHRLILEAVAGYPAAHDGLVGHEVLRTDDGRTLVYLSRWRDEAALEAFAGPGWRTDPVVLPGEEEHLTAPLRVRHFRAEDPGATRRP